ncbi:MAG: dual specificity protein phosphatase family protein [Pontimonas sp.]
MFPPREVLPRVWIGNYQTAMDGDFMRDHRIGLVINCTRHVPSPYSDEIATYRVPVDDARAWSGVLASHVRPVVAAMRRTLRETDRSVLVHCHAGISRSATVVAAYLVLEHGMDAREAIAAIQRSKPETFRPEPVFFDVLSHL